MSSALSTAQQIKKPESKIWTFEVFLET